jgi:hypothetical protein
LYQLEAIWKILLAASSPMNRDIRYIGSVTVDRPEFAKVRNEYKAASQNITANGRYVESRQNHRSKNGCLLPIADIMAFWGMGSSLSSALY